MIKKLGLIFVLLLTLNIGWSEEINHENMDYIAFGNSGFNIEEAKIIKNIKTKDGTVKSENRQSNLVEVKISGVHDKAGITILNKFNFSAVFEYRGFFRVVKAKAVGLKPEVTPGNIVEILVSADDGNINCTNNIAGENQIYFLYFEIPKEISQFQIQVPALLNSNAKL